MNVLGPPKRKRKKEKAHQLKTSCKLTPTKKESTLRSLTNNSTAAEAVAGKRIIGSDDLNTLHDKPNSIQNQENRDIYRIHRVVYKSQQPAMFAGYSAKFRWLLSLLTGC